MQSVVPENRLPISGLEDHMKFICPECGLEYLSQPEWRKHLNIDHDYLNKTAEDFDFREINYQYHECQICNTWVENAHQTIALLQYHRFLHLPYSKTYRCRHCGEAYSRKRALCEHLLEKHVKETKKTQNKGIRDIPPVKNPKENPEFYLRFLCPQCGKFFVRFQLWLNHINTAHVSTSTDLRMNPLTNKKHHYCTQCKNILLTKDKDKLQRHRFSHLPYKSFFVCAFCMVSKTTKSEIFRHFIRVHTKEFEESKMYLQKPVEWGSGISEKLNNELDELLKKNSKPKRQESTLTIFPKENPKPQADKSNLNRSDLIQRALLESLLDLESEMSVDNNEQVVQSNKEFNQLYNDENLHQNQNNLQTAFNSNSLNDSNSVNNSDDITNQKELEDVYAVMFEKIPGRLPLDKYKMCDEPTISFQELVSQKILPSNLHRFRLSDLSHNDVMPFDLKDNKFQPLLESHITYICPECGVDCGKLQNWRKHVFNTHQISACIEKNFQLLDDKCSYICRICSEIQYTKKLPDLQRHYFLHLPYQFYLKCMLCSKTKSTKSKIMQHLRDYHKHVLLRRAELSSDYCKQYKCNNCSKSYQLRLNLVNHQKVCPPHEQKIKLETKISSYKNLAQSLRNKRKNLQKLKHE